jgi:hypothetical protein
MMSEDFSEDFVIEGEEEGSGRPFLITAGALIGVFIVIAACFLVYVVTQQRSDSGTSAEATRITIQNATTNAQNAIVEQTRVAVETRDVLAQLADEATAEAIATADAEVAVLPPTSTPVVQEAAVVDTQATAEAEQAAADAEATATAEAMAAEADATATADALAAASSGSGTGEAGQSGESSGAEATGNTTTALPQTGVEVWLIAVIAMGMIALVFISRRLRTSA